MKVDPIVLGFAIAHLAEADLKPFPQDSDGRRVWWEASRQTVDELAKLIPEGMPKAPEGTQPMFLGYPVHVADHIEPGYLALVEQRSGIGMAYLRDSGS